MSATTRILAAVCPDLAATGSPLLGALGLAVVLMALGLALQIIARRSPRAAVAIVVLLALPVAVLGIGSDTAHAQVTNSTECLASSPTAPNPRPQVSGTAQVVVEQTSTNEGLAPGVAASTLTGQVLNKSTETVYVNDVTVTITGVMKAPQAVAGPCNASDYEIIGARMAVGTVVAPGDDVAFSGASIGFVDKPVNQDACKGATVSLGYVST